MATLLASNNTNDTIDGFNQGDQFGFGESFQTPNAGVAYYLDSASFSFKKVGSPPGVITAYLYAISGSFGTNSIPTGSRLATSTNTFSAADITTTMATYTFTFDGSYLMGINSQYAITFEATPDGDVNNQYKTLDDTTDVAGPPSGNLSVGRVPWLGVVGDLVYAVYGNTTGPRNSNFLMFMPN